MRRNRGLHVDFDGLDELINALQKGAKDLPGVYRAVLKGEGGEAIAATARQRVPRWTGSLSRSIRVRVAKPKDLVQAGLRGLGKAGAVEVGPDGKHPRTKMSLQHVGTWVESGTKPHDIAKGSRTNTRYGHTKKGGLRLASGGYVSGEVKHPGMRARRVMSGSLRAARWEVEAAIEDELRRRQWMAGNE